MHVKIIWEEALTYDFYKIKLYIANPLIKSQVLLLDWWRSGG